MYRLILSCIFGCGLLFVMAFQATYASQNNPRLLSIAVAANFAEPLKALLPEFEATTGIQSRLTVSSSGALYAQIEHGAPYDLFLSADSKRPRALITAGVVSSEQVQTYAMGQLALVGRAEHINDPQLLKAETRLAIAEPKVAPYGRAAQQLLQQTGIWDSLAPRLIRGSNIQQTLQFWQTGNVDVALIAASQCVSYSLECKAVPIAYDPIVQQLAILGTGESAAAAKQLANYLRSQQVQQRLVSMGYEPLNAAVLTGTH